jgi:hypothetical protein
MDALSIIWLVSPVLAYLAVVVFGAVWFRRSRARQFRASRPVRHRLLLAAYLALVFTPSVITDFFLFRFPGPAFLGFLFLIPGTLAHMFSQPSILPFVLRATAVYHILPLGGGFALAYLVLWACNRLRSTPATQSV